MLTTHIYTLTDPLTALLRYVGKTIQKPSRRLHYHLIQGQNARENKHKRNWILQLQSKGLAPILEVIEVVIGDDWAEAEIYWIGYYRFVGCPLLNMTDGGEGVPGLRHSEETCKKISAAGKGRVKSEETRKKLSDAHKGRPNGHLGTKRSTETRKRMSEAQQGRTFSAEHRKHISQALKGHRHFGVRPSVETRRKLSDIRKANPNRFWLGKKRSMETRRKISDAKKGEPSGMLGKHHSAETKKKIGDAMKGRRFKCHSPMIG